MSLITIPKPDIVELRKQLPQEISDILVGDLGDTPNVYFDGNVISWPLLGSAQRDGRLKKDSTVGIIRPGSYEFPTDHNEYVTVLDGILFSSVNKGPESRFVRPDTVVTGAQNLLSVRVEGSQVTYLCQYR